MIWYQPRWQILVAIFSLPHMSSLSFGMITCTDWQLNVVYQHLYAYTPIMTLW